MKAQMFIDGHQLYVYGGLVEDRSLEVTLDDLWCIDLRTRHEWTPVLPGSMHLREWKGDDDRAAGDSDGSSGSGSDDDDDDDGSDGSDDDGDDGDERKAADDVYDMTLRERQKRIKQLRDTHNLGDTDHTPGQGERLADFFRRTVGSWVQKVAASLAPGEKVQGKQLRRKAFLLAKARFDDLYLILEELSELESEQAAMESGRRYKKDKGPKTAKEVRQAKRAAKAQLAALEK